MDAYVLDVTIKDVMKFNGTFFRQPKAPETWDVPMVFIHLGLAEQADCIRLERCAYNEADFRIPDTNGTQLTKAVVTEEDALGYRLETTLELENIHNYLVGKYPNLEISTDPGRYVCNYCYYLSLKGCLESNLQALFVHVPPEHCISLEEQYAFLEDLISFLLK